MTTTLAAGCLAVAVAWRAMLALHDCVQIRRTSPDRRVFRAGRGWTQPDQVDSNRRWAWFGLTAAIALAMTLPGTQAGWANTRPAAMVSILACSALVLWMRRDHRLRHAGFAAVCIASLSFSLLVHQGAAIVLGDPAALPSGGAKLSGPLLAGVSASLFAAQLYLVAGLRKLRSAHFMSGRVILDNLAYGVHQTTAGSREFFPIIRPARLAGLLDNGALLTGCRISAILTAAVELALGLGALGLLPTAVIFALAIPSHLAFTLVNPLRIVPFSTAALGLLVLATTHPLLGASP